MGRITEESIPALVVDRRSGNAPILRGNKIVLRIGADTYTCHELVMLTGLPTTMSATILQKALDGFYPESVKEVARRIEVEDLRANGAGYWSLYVWGLILRHRKVDADRWFKTEKTLMALCAPKRKKWKRKGEKVR